MLKLNEVFTFEKIFDSSTLLFNYIIPELGLQDLYEGQALNGEYFLNHSGEKEISPLLEYVINLSQNDFQYISESVTSIAFQRYGFKWKKLGETLKFKYNPIANVESKETFTYSKIGEEISKTEYGKKDTLTKSDTNTLTKTGSITNDSSGEDVTERKGNKTDIIEKEVSGFNSDTYTPKEKETNASNVEYDTETLKKGVTDTETVNTIDETVINGTDENVQSGIDTHTLQFNNRKDVEERIREGNIGTTMTQQMIQAERELWYNDIIHIFYKDLDTILCIDSY